MGRDGFLVLDFKDWTTFRSTRPHGARPPDRPWLNPATFLFRSTRPHGARQRKDACILGRGALVSIHAPAWGATWRWPRDRSPPCHVSIHAPAWGATGDENFRTALILGFDPRARMGRDKLTPAQKKAVWSFRSTRPHGARRARRASSTPMLRCFDPRARMGRDKCRCRIIKSRSRFRSTRPHGARLRREALQQRAVGVSIHAPAWGATRFDRAQLVGCGEFRSTRPHGARREPRHLAVAHPQVSIHAPAWGATAQPYPIVLPVKTRTLARMSQDAEPGASKNEHGIEKVPLLQWFPISRNCCGFRTRLPFALNRAGRLRSLQTINAPLRSVAGFAPTCSTRLCQFAPR